MAKRKAGLHKEITSIFDGVPIPKNDGVRQPPRAPAADHNGYEEHHKPNEEHQETRVPPKPPAPGPKIPEAPEPQQRVQSLPKAAQTEQPKADTIVQKARQIPWQQTWEQIKNKLFAPKPGVDNKRQKIMTILVPVLFIVFIFVFIKVFSTPASKTQASTKLRPTSTAAGSDNKIDWQIPAPYPTTLRDPMQFGSVMTAQAGTGKLIVKGIVYSEDNAAAVVGTQIVHEGERVSGATVVKINKDSVEFEMNNKRWTQKVRR